MRTLLAAVLTASLLSVIGLPGHLVIVARALILSGGLLLGVRHPEWIVG